MACKKLRRTQLVHEDTRLNEFAYKLQNRIQAALCTNLGVNWSNFLFVDQDDPSTTPQRGSLTDKYGTIQAAVDAALEGDVILINPGEYHENVVLNNIANNVTIQGAGPTETYIIGAVSTLPAVIFSPQATNIPLLSLTIKDLYIQALSHDGVGIPLVVYCDYLPSSFSLGSFILDNVYLASESGTVGSSIFSCINNATFDNVKTDDALSQTTIKNCGLVKVSDSSFRDLVADYDYTETVPTGGRKYYEFLQTNVRAAFTIDNQCIVRFDSECEVNNIIATFTTYLYNDAYVTGLITYEGHVTGDVNGTFTDTHNLEDRILIADFDHAKLDDQFHWVSGTNSSTVFDVVARNAVFSTQPEVSGDIISADGTNIGGLQLCRMDISNSTFRQSCLDITSGSLANATGIDRSVVFYPSNAIAQQPAVTSFAISPPFVSPVYNVHYEVTNSVGFPVIVTSSKAVNSFDASSELADTNACVTLIQQK